MKEAIAITVLFYNKIKQTIDCINSFLPSGQKIYVLNNGSDLTQWTSLQKIYADEKNVELLNAGSNLGVSGGRNYLIQYTKEPWIFSVDNDIIIQSQNGWKQLFDRFLLQVPGTKIICPQIFNVHENSYAGHLYISLIEKKVTADTLVGSISNYFPGGASIIHRSIFDNYGLYDESMFVGFEDYEFALRAILSGRGELKAHLYKEIELIHDHRFQKSAKDKEAVRQRYNEEKIKASYNQMVQKYDIQFEHDWQWWCRQQVTSMTVSDPLLFFMAGLKKLLGK